MARHARIGAVEGRGGRQVSITAVRQIPFGVVVTTGGVIGAAPLVTAREVQARLEQDDFHPGDRVVGRASLLEVDALVPTFLADLRAGQVIVGTLKSLPLQQMGNAS